MINTIIFLITFFQANTPPGELSELNMNYPYIIANGNTKKKITKFYIHIENQLIDLPPDYEFSKVIDFFVKCHMIFNQDSHAFLKPLLNFFNNFIYKNNQEKYSPPNTMFELFRKISN